MMRTSAIISACMLALCGSSAGQDLQSIQKDLDEAIARLSKQREVIAAEKPTLGQSFQTTRADLLEKRRKVRIARMAQSDREIILKELEKKQYTYAQDHDYILGQLGDYGLKFETFLLPGERAAHSAALDNLRRKEPVPVNALRCRLAALESGIEHLEQTMGGHIVKGEAVAPDGEVKEGSFALAGPVAWFIADDTTLAGTVLRERGSEKPRIIPGSRGAIKTVVAGGIADLGIDVTGGKALALTTLESDKLDIFRKGGFWIWPILGIALFSTLCGVMKLIQIIRIFTPQSDWVASILGAVREADMQKATSLAQRASHPVSDVLQRCLAYVKAGPDVVEEVLYEQLIGVQNRLQSWLPFIAITAATAPLLGLLGTVSGMIRTFNVITVSGTGDAKPLAGGISEALVTTLFGLVVAIPALIIHALLSRRCQGIYQNTEKLGLTFVNGLRGKDQSTKI
ncbi:MAG: MotA/TolQ/ExbB proton channel family protein [Akkermansiaceae bacterium]